MGTLYLFKRLVADGWIELVANEKDTQMKFCSPIGKYHYRFEQIVEELARLN